MASVPVVVTGVLFDKVNRTQQLVTLMGELSRADLSVGGGPIIPPGQPPDHIWGPGDPRPTPPIANVPGIDNPNPPGFGTRPTHPIVLPGDPSWGDPHPAHPIVLPPPNLPGPPNGGEAVKPPPDDGGWGYFPNYGWGYFPKAAEPGPKK